MEERFVLDNNDNVIDFEDKTDKYCLSQEDVCNLLNKQDQRIAELEQELAEIKEKAIVPKFKVGQEVWSIFISGYFRDCQKICNLEVTAIMKCRNGVYYQGYILEKGKNRSDYWFNEENTFITEQEAQAKLKEIQGNE